MCSVPIEWEASFQSGWYHGLYTMILARPEYTFGVGFLFVQQRYAKSVTPCVNVRETPRLYAQ
jgi:hypothetical protein